MYRTEVLFSSQSNSSTGQKIRESPHEPKQHTRLGLMVKLERTFDRLSFLAKLPEPSWKHLVYPSTDFGFCSKFEGKIF